jgi:hypothetical protein
MDLAPEDTLRLNVLLRNAAAIRIDEQSMTVHGLSERGEAKVALNPSVRGDRYVRAVREFLSGQVLGSPGGYPVYLKRWTRMGNVTARALAELLMLGEPEAVRAVVRSEGLSAELARRAWWAEPTADTARLLLAHEAVRGDPLGAELAAFLVDFLPFETDTQVIIDTVRAILQPGLIDAATRGGIWDKGARHNAYRIGFLHALADELPEPIAPREDLPRHAASLEAAAAGGNALAALLRKLLDAPGQTFLAACAAVLRSPQDQEAAVALVACIAGYFDPAAGLLARGREAHELVEEARALCRDPGLATGVRGEALRELLAAVPGLREEVAAMVFLGGLSEDVLVPVFSQTDAVGSVMRRRLEPITTPVFEQIARLCPDTARPEHADPPRRGRRARRAP